MSTGSSTEADAIKKHGIAYRTFLGLSDAHLQSPELLMRDRLSSIHLDYNVTLTGTRKCDFYGFARAGLAKSTVINVSLADVSRKYHPPTSRLSREAGTLKDERRFYAFTYQWNDFEYIVYHIQYFRFMGPVDFYIILSRKDTNTEDGDDSPTEQLLLAVGAWSSELHNEIYVYDDSDWEKSSELWKAVQGASWDEVILSPQMKNSLINDVHSFFNNQALYKSLSVPWKRGIILHGQPGNGKTVSIKALIATLGARPSPIPSLYVKSFDAACQSQSPKSCIMEIFSHARTMAPCLLIFEDLDSLVTKENRSYFLNEVDGLESNDGILMVGSTNHLSLLDPAISKRPSRFDRKYHFKLPGEEERRLYCEFWRKKLEGSELAEFPDALVGIVGKLTEGFSFAYLKELFVIALLSIANSAVEGRDTSGDENENDDDTKSLESVGVMVDKTEDTIGDEKAAETEKIKEFKKMKLIPEVEVPKELKGNTLLKALKTQLQILLDEMDNTGTEDESIKTDSGFGKVE